jgi:hypothetical protein
MYVSMYGSMHGSSMYGSKCVSTNAWHACKYACEYACKYACKYVCNERMENDTMKGMKAAMMTLRRTVCDNNDNEGKTNNHVN